jgi:hypothetical protein
MCATTTELHHLVDAYSVMIVPSMCRRRPNLGEQPSLRMLSISSL